MRAWLRKSTFYLSLIAYEMKYLNVEETTELDIFFEDSLLIIGF